MADIEWTDVTAAAPELTDRVVTLEQTHILAYVNDEAFEPSAFGGEESNTLERARVYLAAHMATMGLRAGVPGPITSSTGGKLSLTYATFGLKSSYYATSYGVLLEGLLEALPIRVGFSV
jgi:hypothetical protein